MKRYSELTTAERGAPCVEYPGQWIVYCGESTAVFPSLLAAIDAARSAGVTASVCWSASDNDPRIGEVWFTGFYTHGRTDTFGRYRST